MIAGLAHLIQRKWSLTLFCALSFLLILNLGYWQETMETLAQVEASTVKLMGMCLAGWAMLMMLYLLLYH